MDIVKRHSVLVLCVSFFLADLGLFSLVLVHLLFFLYDPFPYLRKDLIDSDQHS